MKKKGKNLSARHIIRRVIQVLAFLFFPGVFTTVFYAIKTVYINLIQLDFSWETTGIAALMLVGVFGITILFGRIFCGFLCGFGAMQDFMWFLSKHTLKMKQKMPQTIDYKMKYIKYGILVLNIVFFWTLQLKMADMLVSPWAVFGMYTTLSGWSSPKGLMTIGGALLIVIMIASLFVERFFCRYLCPLGAIFSIISRVRPYNIKKERSQCGACRACTNKCPMGISLYEMDRVTSGECITCYSCMDACPRENIKANPNPIIVSVISAVTILAMVYLFSMPQNTSITDTTETESTTEQATNQDNTSDTKENDTPGRYADGTYTGTGTGFRGETEVSVTVENGNITDVTILSYEDDERFLSRPMGTSAYEKTRSSYCA